MLRVFGHSVFSFILLALSVQSARAQEDPREFFQGFIDELHTFWVPLNLQPNASYDSRRAWAENLVETRFDFDHISRRSLGTRWRRLSPEEKADYQVLFKQVVVETVIDWLDGYGGEFFEIKAIRKAGLNTEIQTRFVQIHGQVIKATWVTRETRGRYLFRDVRVSGISLTADFRGRYQSILDDEGVAGLLKILEAELRDMQARQS